MLDGRLFGLVSSDSLIWTIDVDKSERSVEVTFLKQLRGREDMWSRLFVENR